MAPDQSARTGEAGTMPRLVDTHCHLDDESFASDLEDVLARSRSVGVTRWVNVGYAPPRWQESLRLAATQAGMACMLGVHPGHADEWNDSIAVQLADAITAPSVVAVGEIGLDFFRGETNVDEQLDAFTAQLEIAHVAGLPAAIHMRDSESLLLQTVADGRPLPQMLFHSYDGSAALTDWIIEHGAYIGVGGLVTRSKSTALQRQVRRIPINQIVLETDSPYLVPNGFKHRRNTPESIPHVARFLGRLLDRPVHEIAAITTANAEALFERLPIHDA